MQAKGFHVVVEEDAFAEVEQLGVRLVGKQRADIQPQLLEDTLLDDAIAVEQVGEEGIAVDSFEVSFIDRELTRALHVAKYRVHLMTI